LKILFALILSLFLFASVAIGADQETIQRECMPIPVICTIRPGADPHDTLNWFQGEAIQITLNEGNGQEGNLDTCQYSMQLKSDSSVKWTVLLPSNSQRKKLQEEKAK
jgi:hypothetical protein